MVVHHHSKCGGHSHCFDGDMFLVVEGQDSKRAYLNLKLLFFSKIRGMKVHTCHITKSHQIVMLNNHTPPG